MVGFLIGIIWKIMGCVRKKSFWETDSVMNGGDGSKPDTQVGESRVGVQKLAFSPESSMGRAEQKAVTSSAVVTISLCSTTNLLSRHPSLHSSPSAKEHPPSLPLSKDYNAMPTLKEEEEKYKVRLLTEPFLSLLSEDVLDMSFVSYLTLLEEGLGVSRKGGEGNRE
ncbi:hypothetical protein ACLOJK_004904 [Asimina triloba]